MVTPVRVRGGPELVRRLFEPLGYAARVTAADGGAEAPRCWTVSLATATTMQHLLAHLYVLVPVLDDRADHAQP